MTVRGRTAEWRCTRCATSNRKLVPAAATEVRDRCVHCRLRHTVTDGSGAVRWEARPAS